MGASPLKIRDKERRQYQRISVDFEVAIVATKGNGDSPEIEKGMAVNISKSGLWLAPHDASISSLLFVSIVYAAFKSAMGPI